VEFSTVFSKKTLLPRLRRILQYELIGAIVYALLAALKCLGSKEKT
jgi:hypothetical protein